MIMVTDLLGAVLGTDIKGEYYVLQLYFLSTVAIVVSNISPNSQEMEG